MQGRREPSFFPMKKKPAHVGDEEGQMRPAARASLRYFFIASVRTRQLKQMAPRGRSIGFEIYGGIVWSRRWQTGGTRLAEHGIPREPYLGSGPPLAKEQKPGVTCPANSFVEFPAFACHHLHSLSCLSFTIHHVPPPPTTDLQVQPPPIHTFRVIHQSTIQNQPHLYITWIVCHN